MRFFLLFTSLFLLVIFGACQNDQAVVAEQPDVDWPADSIHPTGLVYAPGFPLVRGNCTTCHSAALIVQNRATRAGWEGMIRWMQETQGLHDLGEDEAAILDYLAAHYAPVEVGRRANLDVESIEWYPLE